MTKKNIFLALSVLILFLASFAVPPGAAPVAARMKGEQFSALGFLPTGAGMRGVGAGSTMNLTIYVNQYTTDAEAQDYAKTLFEQGPDDLLKRLEKAKAIGKVTALRHMGFFDLKLIRTRPLPGGGRRIVGVCDRPIQFLEAYYGGRSLDNKFGIVILDVKPNSKGREEGQGQLIYAAKVKVLEGNKIEVENYGIEPARLQGVRRQ
jgi:hypothetical protein